MKLFLAAIEPASFDLRDIIQFPGPRHNPLGPWIALYPPLYNHWANSTQIAIWVLSPPSVDGSLVLTSLSFRLPVFVLDLAIAIILYYLAKRMASAVEGRLACLVWFANPLCFFGIELLGVPDVAATFLVTVALALLLSRRAVLGGAVLGIAIWFKFYPFLLLPPVLLYAHSHGISRRSKFAVLCFGLLGLVSYLSWTYTSDFFFLTNYTPLTQPLPFIAGAGTVNSATFVLIFFYCLLGVFAKKTKDLIAMLLPALLVYYAVSNPYPQYLIWAMPLMALDIALVNRSRSLLFVIFNALSFAQWIFTSSAFLTPSSYSLLLFSLAGVSSGFLLSESYSYTLLMPIVSSSFFAVVLFYALDVGRSWFNVASEGQKL